MPQLVDVEGIGQVEFPDHYTPAMIQDYWKQNFQPRLQQEQRIQAGLEASRRPEDTPNWDALKSTARQMVTDPAIDIARGVVGVPETAVGLLDIPTMGYTGKALENIPYGPRFGETKQILGDLYSPERKAAMEKVKEAKGFTPTLEAMVENPSTLVGTTLESLPSMFGGGALAQKGLSTLAKLGPRAAAFAAGETAPVVAGALGEGLVSAGQTAEQIREETPNRALTWDQAGLALASGALTGGIGVAAGKLAQKLGIENRHTLMAKGKSSTTAKDLGERIVKGIGGAITEGFFEELPQSTQEQIAQNIALGKPWDEGVGEQAAAGLLAGAAMGGVAGAFGPGHHAPGGTQTPPPAAGPQAPSGPAPTTPSPVLPQTPAPAPQVTPTAPATGAPPTRPSLPQGATQAQIGNAPQQESQSNNYWSEWQKGEPVPVKIENLSHFKNIFGLLTPEGQSQLISSMGMTAQDAKDLVSGKSNLTSLNAKLEFDLPRSYFSQDAMRSFWGAMRNRPEPAKPASRLTLSGNTELPQATRSALASPQAGIDYASMSQDQWAKALSVNPSLADTRGQRGIYNALTLRPELRAKPYFSISSELAAKAYDLMDRIKSETGMIGSSTGWMYKNFGDSKTKNPDGTRSKAYLTVKNPIENLTPERMSELVKELEKSGYNGSVKTVQKAPFTAERLIKSFDNVVFHGKTQSDVDIAASIAQRIFGKAGSVSFGIDPVGTSHTDHLASLVAKSIGNRTELKIPERRISVQTAPIIRPEASMVAPQQAPLGIQRGPVVTPEIAAAAREALTYNPRVPELKRVENAREIIQGMRRLSLTNPNQKAVAAQGPAWKKEMYHGESQNATKSNEDYTERTDLGPGKYWTDEPSVARYFSGREDMAGVTKGKPNVENPLNFLGDWMSTPEFAKLKKLLGDKFPNWSAEKWNNISNPYNVLARAAGGKAELAKLLVEAGYDGIVNRGISGFGDLPIQVVELSKKPAAPAEPEYTVGSGVPYAGRIYRVLSVKGDKVHIQDSAVGGEKRWVSKGQLKLAQEMSRQQMPEEAPDELPIAPAQQFGRGDGFYITQKGLDIGEGPFNSRDEAAQFAESEVGGRVKIVEVVKGKLTGGPKRATVGRMIEATPETPASTKDPNIGRTWNSPYGNQTITGVEHWAGKDHYQVTDPSGAVRMYDADDLEQRIKQDQYRTTPEYAKEQDDKKEIARMRAERDARQAEKKAKSDAEIAEFTKSMTPMAAAKAKAALEMEVLNNGVITTRKRLIDSRVADGARVVTENGERILENPSGSFLGSKALTKTGLDYAEYLIGTISESPTAPLSTETPSPTPAEIRPQIVAQETVLKPEEQRDEGNLGRFLKIFPDPLSVGDMAVSSDKSIRQNQRSILEKLYPDYKPTRHDAFVERYNYQLGQARLAVYEQNRGISQKEAVAPIPSSQLTPAQRATAEGQKKMASEAASVATVLLLNEKVRQKSPSEAWDAKQIHAATGNQSMLNSIRDDLLPIYNRLYAKVAPEVENPKAEAGLIAATPPAQRADVNNGTRTQEFRVRKTTSAEMGEQWINYYTTPWVVERRVVKHDLDTGVVDYGEWSPFARGETRQKAIEDAMADTQFLNADSRDDTHAKIKARVLDEHTWRSDRKKRLDEALQELRWAEESLLKVKEEANKKYNTALKRAKLYEAAQSGQADPKKIDAIRTKLQAEFLPLRDKAQENINRTSAAVKAIEAEQYKPSPQTITGSNVQTGTEMPVPPSAAPLTQGREAGGEPTAIDKSKPSQFLTKAEVDRLVNLAKTSPENAAQDIRDRWSGDKLSTRTWLSELKVSHPYGIRVASELKLPVSAAAVDAYNIKLPPGYVREGDLYVWRGEGSTAQPLTTDAAIATEPPIQKPPEARDWDLLYENLSGNLDAFNPARHSGRRNHELDDMAQRFVDFAKTNKSGIPLIGLVKEFAKTDEASASQIRKLREAVKYVVAEETFPNLSIDAAIKAIDELQKKIKGKQFSDPFLSTVWGPVALQVAKHLLRVGRPIEIAIREAIDKVRQQFPASNIDPQQAEQAIQTELATENEVLNAAERTKINRMEVDAAAEAIPHMASQQYADLESGYGTLEQAAFEKQQFRKAKSDLATLVNLADGVIRKLPDDRRHPDLYPKVTDGVSVTNGRVTVDDTFSNKLAALGVQHNPDNVKAMQAELYFEQLARKAADARERLQDLQDRLAYYQKIKAPDADIKRLQDLIAQNTTAASNAEAVALERNGADVLVGERTNELQQAEAKRMEAQAKVDALHIGPVAEFFGAGIAKLRNLFEKAKASAALIEELRKTTTDPEKLKALADEYRRYGDLPTTIEKAIAEDSPLNQRQQDAAAAELQKSLAEFNDARDEMNALLQQEEHTIIQQIEEAQKSFSKSANSVQENEALVQSALNAAKGDPALAHSVLAAAEINSLLNNVTAIANLAKHLGENLTQNRWLYDFLSGWRSSPGGSVTFSNLDAASLNVSPEVLQKVIDVASSSPSFASSIVALADAAAAAKAASVPIQLAGTLPSISDALKQGGKKGIDTAAQIASQFSRAVNPAITASRADNRQAARQINSLLTRLMALHHGANLFNNLAQSPQFQTLRQNIIVGSGGAPQQMIDRRPTGFTFREFGEAGKTPAHGEVILNVSEDPSSMERARKKMFAWFSAAEKYVAAYDQAVWLHALDPKTSKSPAELGFNESVARGLAAEIDVGRGEFLDQTFNRLKTTDSARKLMKLPLFRQHDAASRMVGGLVGAAMRSSLGRWVQGMMDSKRVMARFEDLPDLTSKALHSHYDPKNPKDNSYLNYDTYRKQVWNPMAHEGRKFDSDLKVGFQLPTGAIVTKEDIALLERSLVLNGMQRTEVSETNPLRGVHVTVGGKTYIRPSSSVGVFGMDRHLNRNANAFVADSTVAYRDTPGFDSSTDLSSASSNPVVQFWNNRNQMLIDHVVDSDRTDRKMKLDPAMQDAEKRLAALWKAGLETKPSNLAELVSQLATTLNPMAGVNPVSYVTERLNSELLNYQKEAARIQQERNDESTKNTGLKIALSADNEFTKPAAQLELPSSLYDYGALTPGERIARQSSANHQNLVEYANSVRRAIEELQTRLKRYNDGKLSAKEAAENYGGNVSEMKDTLEILRAILKDFEAAFSVNDPSLAPTRLASEISKWAVSGVLALPTVNFRNMTGGQFLVYLSDIAMGITLNRLALWNAVANMPKGLARLAYVWANGTAKFVDKNLVRHGNALEKVVDVVADAALAPARMALKNPAISTAGWKAQLEQVKNLGYDTKQGWVDAMKAAWLQSALFTNREEQEWAARNPKLAAANRAALTAAKTINAFFGSIGVENSDQVLNSLNLASAAALEQRLTEVARQYGKRLEDSGHTVFDPSDPAFQLKPSEWTTGGNEQARDDALANARLLFQTSASAEGFQLEHALWKFYQDEKAGRPASIYTDRQREAVTRTLLAMMNASLPTNRASVGAGNPLWRSVLTLQGYPADAMMKLINVSFGGTRDRRVAATIGAKLPMLFGIAAMMVLAGAAADGASEYWKRRMQAIQSAQAGVLDKDFWENKDKMASGVGRFLASNMFYLGDFILGMQNQVQGGKGFDPASRVFLVSVVNALTQAVRESYATYSGAGPASHVVQPFIDFAARLTPGANEIRKLFGDNTYEQQAKNVSRAEARSLGMELPKTGAAPSAGPTTVARRFLASAVGEMEEARRKNDQVAYQKAFTKAQEEIGYLQEYYVKHRTELGDSPADAEKHAKQAVWRDYQEINPVVAALGGRRPTAAELQSITSGPTGERAEAQQRGMEAWQAGAQALFGKTGATTKEEVASSRGGGIPANLSVPATGGGGGGGSTGTISTGRGAPSRLRSVRLGRLALRPHQPQKGRLSLSSAGSRLPRPRATTFKRLSLSTHIA